MAEGQLSFQPQSGQLDSAAVHRRNCVHDGGSGCVCHDLQEAESQYQIQQAANGVIDCLNDVVGCVTS